MPRPKSNATKADKAFLASAGHKFAGIKLHPMTKQRELAACEMGLRFGFTEHYCRQFLLRDTIIAMWLCSIPAEGKGWTVDRAEMEPLGAWKQAQGFAKTHSIGIGTKRLTEASDVFLAMMKEIQESKGEPVIPKDEQREESDSGEL